MTRQYIISNEITPKHARTDLFSYYVIAFSPEDVVQQFPLPHRILTAWQGRHDKIR
ncbi:hypothetical protein F8B43_4314 [Methylorubrum populi]|uniref:Uncharacterized protein n=1 Tax=Methylorubrum populi TaxID=223967 RepID=A0A833J1R6_9HYPH|nr:hypothetical protein F8B43_4314 [Methylorubrum populi]